MILRGKKLACWLLTLCMLLALLPAAALAADETAFSDMPAPDHWSYSALAAAVENGLLHGDDGKLMPDDPLTRAQLAAIVNRAYGAQDTASISAYSDIPADAWYRDDIAKAVRMGTFQGDGSTMRPDDPVTRQEAFTVLARAFRLADGDGAVLAQFADAASVADWAKGSVSAMVAAGYVNGKDGAICPGDPITRAEFVQVMYKMLAHYISEAGTYTEDMTGNVIINKPDVTLKNMKIDGDLIIGEGVGNGDVTLDNVKLGGRMVVRGGGEQSIHILNSTSIGDLYIFKTGDGGVRVFTAKGCEVEIVKIEDGDDKVVLEGDFNQVIVETDTPIELKDAEVSGVSVKAEGASINVTGADSKIGTVTVEADAVGTELTVDKGAEVAQVVAQAEKTEVSGDGTVKSVQVQADDAKIDTNGTAVTVDDGVSGTTAGGKTVEGGTSTTTPASGSGTSSGGSTGGGGGGGGGTTAPTPADVVFTGAETYAGATETLKVNYSDGSSQNRDFTVARTDADIKTALAAGKDTVIAPTYDENNDLVPSEIGGTFATGNAILVVAPKARVTITEATTFSGYVQNSGTLEIKGTDVTLNCSKFLNAGSFYSYYVDDGITQSLTNKGTLFNAPAGSMELRSITVENSGSITNVAYDSQMNGRIRAYAGSSFRNTGTIYNLSTPADNGGSYFAQFNVFGDSEFTNESKGVVNNSGRFYVAVGSSGNGDLKAKTAYNEAESTPSSFLNKGIFNNDRPGYFSVEGSSFENSGTVNNSGQIFVRDMVGARFDMKLEVVTENPGTYWTRNSEGYWIITERTISNVRILPASFANSGTINTSSSGNNWGWLRLDCSGGAVNTGTINSSGGIDVVTITPENFMLNWFKVNGETDEEAMAARRAAVSGLTVPRATFVNSGELNLGTASDTTTYRLNVINADFTNNGKLYANAYVRLENSDFTHGANAKTELTYSYNMYGGTLTVPAGADFTSVWGMWLYDVYGDATQAVMLDWPDLQTWLSDGRNKGSFNRAIQATTFTGLKNAEQLGGSKYTWMNIVGDIEITEDLTLSNYRTYEYRTPDSNTVTTLHVTNGAKLTIETPANSTNGRVDFRVQGNGNNNVAKMVVDQDSQVILNNAQLRFFFNGGFEGHKNVTLNGGAEFALIAQDNGDGTFRRIGNVSGEPAEARDHAFVTSDAGLYSALEGEFDDVIVVSGSVVTLKQTPNVSSRVNRISVSDACGIMINPGVTLTLDTPVNGYFNLNNGTSLGVYGTLVLGESVRLNNNGHIDIGATDSSEVGEIRCAGYFNNQKTGTIHVYETGSICMENWPMDQYGKITVDYGGTGRVLTVVQQQGNYDAPYAIDADTGVIELYRDYYGKTTVVDGIAPAPVYTQNGVFEIAMANQGESYKIYENGVELAFDQTVSGGKTILAQKPGEAWVTNPPDVVLEIKLQSGLTLRYHYF